MKRILLLVAVVLIGLTATAQNRGGRGGQRGFSPQQALQHAAERFAKEMKLDNATKEWFMPLYVEYRDTLMAVQRQQRVDEKALEGMDDVAVTALIEQSLEKDVAVTSLKRAYLAKFREKLTEKQVYRVMVGGMRPRGGDQQRQRDNFGQGGFPEGGPGGFPGGPGGFPGGGPDF